MKPQSIGRKISQRRGAETASQIILTAERLWGQRGMEGASLREICAEAGCSNKAAIGYYFGDKESLIAAIFENRFPLLETIRHPLLEELERSGRLGSLKDLLGALFRPLTLILDENGARAYARFIRSRRGGSDLPISTRMKSPAAFRILDLIREAVAHIDDNKFQARWEIARNMCLSAIVASDESKWSADFGEVILSDTLDAAAYYLKLP